jgi:hypothetical protein
MLITEYFFLIACDPRSGQLAWPRRQQDANQLAAAALALDLAVAERLQWDDGYLHADTGFPLNNPLLSDAMRLLAAYDLTVDEALSALPQRVLDALFRRDLVHRLESRDWLLRKRVRYPLRSMQARNEALLRLQGAAHEDDPSGLALLMLADLSGLLAVHLQARDHEAAMRRLLALNVVGDNVQPARRVLAAIRATLLA